MDELAVRERVLIGHDHRKFRYVEETSLPLYGGRNSVRSADIPSHFPHDLAVLIP